MSSCRSPWWSVAAVVLLAIGLRTALVVARSASLGDDRDAYLAIARQVAEGRGFVSPGSGEPTAYRPPLYPLLLALLPPTDPPWGVGILQILCGAATVGLTWLLGRRLSLPHRGALLAASAVALDPLLLQYTTLPMTEVVSTMLTVALLAALAGGAIRPGAPPPPVRRQILAGVLFGLGALCRPTIWAFALALAGWYAIACVHGAGRRASLLRSVPWWILAAALVTVAPWCARNVAHFGRPILTTTHGGYTLLLGNNADFYRDVVDAPWGTVWEEGQQRWVDQLNAEMAARGLIGEVERDRFLADLAWRTMASDPRHAVKASLQRIARFWNVVPTGPAADGVPPPVRWLVGGWYVVISLAAVVGFLRLARDERSAWMPALLLIASFTAVHSLYWSNTRMRAPLIPAVAVLAARAFGRGGCRQPDHVPDGEPAAP